MMVEKDMLGGQPFLPEELRLHTYMTMQEHLGDSFAARVEGGALVLTTTLWPNEYGHWQAEADIKGEGPLEWRYARCLIESGFKEERLVRSVGRALGCALAQDIIA